MPPASRCVAEERLIIRPDTQVAYVQARVRRFASLHGFPPREEWMIAIAASEAVTNILKYASDGELRLRMLDGEPAMLELEAVDEGPGVGDLSSAVTDGVSEGFDQAVDPRIGDRRGLGFGLGAIRRLMDEVEVQARTPSGTRLVARKRLPVPRA